MSNKVILTILDGWGIAPPSDGNPIAQLNPPEFSRLFSHFPHSQLEASGIGVGLPPNQDGNSETGHLNIGAGRIVFQVLTKINMDIASGNFFNHQELIKTVDHLKNHHSTLHLMGLIGASGVHAFNEHLYSLIIFAKRHGLSQVYLHLFTDGRDSPPKDAINQIKNIQTVLDKYQLGQVVSLVGRYYAMDRDNKLDRTQKAFDLLINGSSNIFPNPLEAISNYYQQNITDEFIPPTVIGDSQEGRVKPGDAVIFFNFRNDRPRQLTKMFLDKNIPELRFITMTQYQSDFNCPYLYPTDKVDKPLAEVVSDNHLIQLRASESEKERVMNYYFDGQREQSFPGCDKLVVPSPKVATYDLQPAMSTPALIDQAFEAFLKKDYSLLVINIACPDMLGHTGMIDKAKEAILATDDALKKLVDLANKTNSYLLITADHGNIEEMLNLKTGEVDTKHSSNPVPLIIYHSTDQHFLLQNGVLGDIAPTALHLIGLKQPTEMTGKNLLVSA